MPVARTRHRDEHSVNDPSFPFWMPSELLTQGRLGNRNMATLGSMPKKSYKYSVPVFGPISLRTKDDDGWMAGQGSLDLALTSFTTSIHYHRHTRMNGCREGVVGVSSCPGRLFQTPMVLANWRWSFTLLSLGPKTSSFFLSFWLGDVDNRQSLTLPISRESGETTQNSTGRSQRVRRSNPYSIRRRPQTATPSTGDCLHKEEVVGLGDCFFC